MNKTSNTPEGKKEGSIKSSSKVQNYSVDKMAIIHFIVKI